MIMTEEEYVGETEEMNGYCTACDKVTRFGMTEPDAREYKCPECGRMTAMGVEQAMMEGHITIND